MKKIIYLILFLVNMNIIFGQELPKEAYLLYPTLQDMSGYAVGKWQNKLLIFGGRIKSDVPDIYKKDFPNLEIILIDLVQKRASAYNSGNLEGVLGEQMASTGLAYYQKSNLLYIAGGYGYSDEVRSFITFPYFTVIDLELTIPALVAGKSPVAHIYQICDERIAIFNGTLDFNGDEFFLINGKYAYKLQPFEDQPTYYEEDREGEGATFRLSQDGKALSIKAFKNWYDLQELLDYYSNNLPPNAQKEAEKTIKKKTSQ
ncbi:MAG: hypothetical protein ACK4TA_00300 [Saprospiraceae bacterium]